MTDVEGHSLVVPQLPADASGAVVASAGAQVVRAVRCAKKAKKPVALGAFGAGARKDECWSLMAYQKRIYSHSKTGQWARRRGQNPLFSTQKGSFRQPSTRHAAAAAGPGPSSRALFSEMSHVTGVFAH